MEAVHHRSVIENFYDFGQAYNKRILEIGFGSGQLLARMAKRGGRCTGMEISRNAIHSLKKRFSEGINFVLGALPNLPFRSIKFDLVVVSHVLEHVQDDRKSFKEISRVLKPGGRFILYVPTGFAEHPLHLRDYPKARIMEFCESYSLTVRKVSQECSFLLKFLTKLREKIEGVLHQQTAKPHRKDPRINSLLENFCLPFLHLVPILSKIDSLIVKVTNLSNESLYLIEKTRVF
ncbi:class I SAM-dependent methyltransferase [Candidatus Aerophobetes bacterium]|nr:class I SAM-dependent methyltransferase [Candidatus Aerophobetes bacterium]